MRSSQNPVIMDDTSAAQESRSAADSFSQEQAKTKSQFSVSFSRLSNRVIQGQEPSSAFTPPTIFESRSRFFIPPVGKLESDTHVDKPDLIASLSGANSVAKIRHDVILKKQIKGIYLISSLKFTVVEKVDKSNSESG